MKKRHLQSGASLPLMVVLAIVLLLIGGAVFYLVMFMGGQKELSNAADSGALNVAKTALTSPSVTLSDVSQDAVTYFKGLGDGPNKDQINLGNINGVWGAALLVGLNYEAMANPTNSGSKAIKSGKSGDDALNNAKKMAQAASDVAKALKAKLTDSSDLKTAFVNFAGANSTRMLDGKGATPKAVGSWTVAFEDKGASSNFMIKSSQIPEGLSDSTKSLVKPDQGIPGYTDITLPTSGISYCFVPLTGKPHLVSTNDFTSNTSVQGVSATTKDSYVPNTFMVRGQVAAKKEGENTIGLADVTSYSEAGDLKMRTVSIPGFVRISNYKAMQPEGGPFKALSVSGKSLTAVNISTARPGGLEAIEYLNFQMLYARSNGDGPKGTKDDALVQLMDTPVLLIKDPNNPSKPPLRTADNSSYVFGSELAVRDTYENKLKDKASGDPMPDAQPTSQYGGGNQWECLNAPLPNSYIDKGEQDPTKLANYLNPSNCKRVDEKAIGIQAPNNDVIADAWYTEQVNFLGPHDDDMLYGSTAHPHIWSRGPLVESGRNVVLCQQAPGLSFTKGWNNPNSTTAAPQVYEWLTNTVSGGSKSNPGAQLFSGMMVIAPNRQKLSLAHPAQFIGARYPTVRELLFPDESYWSEAQMRTGNAGLGTQYQEELKFFHKSIIGRLLTRLNQIDPTTTFTEASLKASLTGTNNPQVPMGKNAYMYPGPLGSVICRVDGAPSGYATAQPDGHPLGESLDKETANARVDNPFDENLNTVAYIGPRYPNKEGIYNVANDWPQFNTPFINQQTNEQNATDVRWWAMYVLTPSTGASGGMLADLSAREFFNQPDTSVGWNGKGSQAGLPNPCAVTLTTNSGKYHGARPIDCPCECFPDYSAGAFVPDTSKLRLAQSKVLQRHKGISAQPHGGGAAPPPANNNNNNNGGGARCKPNCSHGGPC